MSRHERCSGFFANSQAPTATPRAALAATQRPWSWPAPGFKPWGAQSHATPARSLARSCARPLVRSLVAAGKARKLHVASCIETAHQTSARAHERAGERGAHAHARDAPPPPPRCRRRRRRHRRRRHHARHASCTFASCIGTAHQTSARAHERMSERAGERGRGCIMQPPGLEPGCWP